MATLQKERHIDTPASAAWAALSDWGALHERLVPGFVTDTRLDGQDRLVTFFNGVIARERLVTLDEERMRLVWSIIDGPYAHHNGAAQVHEDPQGGVRFVWTADILPDELAGRTEEMMEHGIEVLKSTLESNSSASS